MLKLLGPAKPGKLLSKKFMEPAHISQNQLARDIDVPPGRVNEIIQGKRAITADTALRLAQYFGNDASFWMDIQRDYDLYMTRRKSWGTIKKNVKQATKA